MALFWYSSLVAECSIPHKKAQSVFPDVQSHSQFGCCQGRYIRMASAEYDSMISCP